MNIVGIVLAGGLSTRMGKDKANLKLAERTLLSRAVTLLDGLDFSATFVSGNYPEYDCIKDISVNNGPLSGIHACATALYPHYDALFIIPVDMPLLVKEHCLQLLEAFKEHPQGVYFEGATMPMILPLNKLLCDYLQSSLQFTEKKQFSLMRLLNTLQIQAIATNPSQYIYFKNSNTPQQWMECVNTFQKIKDNI
ncbi:molybdenum cofactor guanylyltransferase [Psychromonas sp. MME2]|uniref:molybdenum cofactor guanylyltransferase n=1 Tax=unclassified Psychromonas TaxID=2614957 RepID=UPI00339CDD56